MEQLLKPKPTWQTSRDHFGSDWRPRLLAGMLIICDELDGDFMRIRQPDRIGGWDLDARARRHWLACLFVQKIQLSIDKDQGNLIVIQWQIPRDCTEDDKKQIRMLLESMREAKIKDEIQRVNSFYDQCREHTYEKKIHIKPILEVEPVEFVFPIDKDLRHLLSEEVKKRYDSSGKTRKETVLSLDKARDEIRSDVSSYAVEEETQSLDDALKNWFKKQENRDIRHFELSGGEHTDTYLNCRSLASDQNLIEKIVERVVDYYRRVGIEYVLAVGTSAIPLAVNLAYRLQCGVTFTMSRIRPYHKVEFEPILPAGKKVLIVDDVISGGSVAVKVLDLLEKLRMKPKKAWHFAIFRLGKRGFKKDRRLSNRYKSIIVFPEVYYATTSNKCKLCALGMQLQKEIDMR